MDTPRDLTEGLDDLLREHDLLHLRERVLAVGRPAVALVEPDAGGVPAVRVGGHPRMPAGVAWPEVEGKSISFLWEVDLSALAACQPGLPFPEHGRLLLFSYSGWYADFFDAPEEVLRAWDLADAVSESVLLWIPEDDTGCVERHPKEGTPVYQPGELHARPFLSLPNSDDEAAWGRIGLSPEESRRFADASDAWLDRCAGEREDTGRNQLGGYAECEQYGVEEAQEGDLTLAVQVASGTQPVDFAVGDGGVVFGWGDPEKTGRGDFSGMVWSNQ